MAYDNYPLPENGDESGEVGYGNPLSTAQYKPVTKKGKSISFETEWVTLEIKTETYIYHVLMNHWPNQLHKYVVKKVYRKVIERNTVSYDTPLKPGDKIDVLIPKNVIYNLPEIAVVGYKNPPDVRTVKNRTDLFFNTMLDNQSRALKTLKIYLDKMPIKHTDIETIILTALYESALKTLVPKFFSDVAGEGAPILKIIYGALKASYETYAAEQAANAAAIEQNANLDFLLESQKQAEILINKMSAATSEKIENANLSGDELGQIYDIFERQNAFQMAVGRPLFTLEHILNFINYKGGSITFHMSKSYLYTDKNGNALNFARYITVSGTGVDQQLSNAINELCIDDNRLWTHYFSAVIGEMPSKKYIPLFLFSVPIRYEIEDLFGTRHIYLDQKHNIRQSSTFVRNYYYDTNEANYFFENWFELTSDVFFFDLGNFDYFLVPYKLDTPI